MFLPDWHKRFDQKYTNRAARRRRDKFRPKLQTLESRSLLTVVPTGVVITPVEGKVFTGSVATFTSADTLADMSATVDWGDGTTDVGTVSGGGGNFTVAGIHTYAEDGSEMVSVAIVDSADLTTATAASTATISEGTFFLLSGGTISATEGTAVTGFQAATFNDPGSPDTAADFASTIDWGDGVTTAGTISGGGGNFTVTGNHTYADELNGSYHVAVTEPSASFTLGPIGNGVRVADADILSLTTAAAISTTEGAAFTGATLATFSDAGFASNVAGDFTASVDWGDGTTGVGTVSGGGGADLTVSGVHTYVDEGSFPVTITLSDDAPGTAAATATTTATVAEGDFGNLLPMTVTPTEGQAFSGGVASFTDAGNPDQVAGDFSATINWGDGTTTTGTVSGSTGGPFTISGAHTYADEGSFKVLAAFADDSPSTLSATITSTAAVADGDTLLAGTATLSATEGATFTGTVATFSDTTYAGNLPADFTATIDWGDGTTDVGTVSGGGGTFTVSGSHSYAEEGSLNASIVLSDDAPGTAKGTATTSIDVADAPLSATAVAITSPEYATFSGLVATFTDADPNGTAADYTATIAWGDGVTSAGTIAASGGGFIVSGSHAYGEDGTHTFTATIADAGGSTATAGAAANITEQTISATAVAVNGYERSPLANVALATFTHGTGGEPTSGFSVSIEWGDGSTSTGSVSESGTTYTVSGSHTYLDEGTYPIAFQVFDGSGSSSFTTSATLKEELLPNGTVGTVNQRFIQEVYRDLLHRQVDDLGLAYWTNLLDQGETRLQVVTVIISDAMQGELAAEVVTGIYEKYLGREPDAAGLAAWVPILASQQETIEQVEADIAGSPEFFAQSGGTNSGFITHLFNLALGRNPEPAAQSGLNAILSAGTTREQVAELVFSSPEFHRDEVAGYYQSPSDANGSPSVAVPFIDDLDFLDRPADPLGQAGFAAELDLGVRDQVIWADFMASDEFFAKIT